jgi:DNA adenine methylase
MGGCMPTTLTPLRYPGGKTQFYPLIRGLLKDNNLLGHTYVEPFAGGAGIAIKLLLNNDVNRIIINDIDPAIYAFWYSVLNYTDGLCTLIEKTPITIEQWYKQKKIYNSKNAEILNKGFATLFLNRTNVSGIIKGGIIGGLQQKGTYSIDARFIKETLVKKIKAIGGLKEQIDLFNFDAIQLFDLEQIKKSKKTFVNFDPPYVSKGSGLYENSFSNADHKKLAAKIKKCGRKWVVTYDVHPLITELYTDFRCDYLELNYSINQKRKAKEYIFFSSNMEISKSIKSYFRTEKTGGCNG